MAALRPLGPCGSGCRLAPSSPTAKDRGALRYDRPGRPRSDSEYTPSGRIHQCRRFMNIGAPVLQGPDTGRGLTLIFLAASGTHVKEGQIVAEIDSQDIQDHLVDVEANLSQAKLDIARRKAHARRTNGGPQPAPPRRQGHAGKGQAGCARHPGQEHDHAGDSATRRRGISGGLTRKPSNRCRLPRSASFPTSSSMS